MTLEEGRRVTLAVDIRLAGELAADIGPVGTPAVPVAGFLALAAGAEGTVERVDEQQRQESREVREYERLTSLLESFGRDMPPESKRRLEEQVASLEPAWAAFQEQRPGSTVRVRFDNGFVLDGTPEDAFTASAGEGR
ncbi:hypothetical protein [Streptomyces sp. NPDC031705]|uniref:hypothetical protein n=1 Tax=Streptomyces sp. NPDC031705 TaxID=3155729 RepID=UPI0033C813A0